MASTPSRFIIGHWDNSRPASDIRAGLTSSKEVEYTVTAVNGEWRITDAEPNFPHVSRAAMLKWLNDQISTTQDAIAKNLYQEAVRQLQVAARIRQLRSKTLRGSTAERLLWRRGSLLNPRPNWRAAAVSPRRIRGHRGCGISGPPIPLPWDQRSVVRLPGR